MSVKIDKEIIDLNSFLNIDTYTAFERLINIILNNEKTFESYKNKVISLEKELEIKKKEISELNNVIIERDSTIYNLETKIKNFNKNHIKNKTKEEFNENKNITELLKENPSTKEDMDAYKFYYYIDKININIINKYIKEHGLNNFKGLGQYMDENKIIILSDKNEYKINNNINSGEYEYESYFYFLENYIKNHPIELVSELVDDIKIYKYIINDTIKYEQILYENIIKLSKEYNEIELNMSIKTETNELFGFYYLVDKINNYILDLIEPYDYEKYANEFLKYKIIIKDDSRYKFNEIFNDIPQINIPHFKQCVKYLKKIVDKYETLINIEPQDYGNITFDKYSIKSLKNNYIYYIPYRFQLTYIKKLSEHNLNILKNDYNKLKNDYNQLKYYYNQLIELKNTLENKIEEKEFANRMVSALKKQKLIENKNLIKRNQVLEENNQYLKLSNESLINGETYDINDIYYNSQQKYYVYYLINSAYEQIIKIWSKKYNDDNPNKYINNINDLNDFILKTKTFYDNYKIFDYMNGPINVNNNLYHLKDKKLKIILDALKTILNTGINIKELNEEKNNENYYNDYHYINKTTFKIKDNNTNDFIIKGYSIDGLIYKSKIDTVYIILQSLISDLDNNNKKIESIKNELNIKNEELKSKIDILDKNNKIIQLNRIEYEKLKFKFNSIYLKDTKYLNLYYVDSVNRPISTNNLYQPNTIDYLLNKKEIEDWNEYYKNIEPDKYKSDINIINVLYDYLSKEPETSIVQYLESPKKNDKKTIDKLFELSKLTKNSKLYCSFYENDYKHFTSVKNGEIAYRKRPLFVTWNLNSAIISKTMKKEKDQKIVLFILQVLSDNINSIPIYLNDKTNKDFNIVWENDYLLISGNLKIEITNIEENVYLEYLDEERISHRKNKSNKIGEYYYEPIDVKGEYFKIIHANVTSESNEKKSYHFFTIGNKYKL